MARETSLPNKLLIVLNAAIRSFKVSNGKASEIGSSFSSGPAGKCSEENALLN